MGMWHVFFQILARIIFEKKNIEMWAEKNA